MLRRINPKYPTSKRVDSRTQHQRQRRLQPRTPQPMQRLRQLLSHQLLFVRQFYVIRECRFDERRQQEGHFQAHQQRKEEQTDNQQVTNIHHNDAVRAVANFKRGSSHDDEIERAQHSPNNGYALPRQVTDCSENI